MSYRASTTRMSLKPQESSRQDNIHQSTRKDQTPASEVPTPIHWYGCHCVEKNSTDILSTMLSIVKTVSVTEEIKI